MTSENIKMFRICAEHRINRDVDKSVRRIGQNDIKYITLLVNWVSSKLNQTFIVAKVTELNGKLSSSCRRRP